MDKEPNEAVDQSVDTPQDIAAENPQPQEGQPEKVPQNPQEVKDPKERKPLFRKEEAKKQSSVVLASLAMALALFALYPTTIHGWFRQVSDARSTPFVRHNPDQTFYELPEPTYYSPDAFPGSGSFQNGEREMDFQALEPAVHDRANFYRRQQSIDALIFSQEISELARVSSEELASNYPEQGPLGYQETRSADPYADLGLTCGENVLIRPRAEGYTQVGDTVLLEGDLFLMSHGELANDLVLQWVNSPAHATNLRSPSYEIGGVGAYYSHEVEKLFVTQVLCFQG